MNLNKLYSDTRTGSQPVNRNADIRSEFQRDFDRIIFSSAFRRLQNKTQVFPLPGSVFVHNRLTHSLEVASVGRSLGTIIGDHIATTFSNDLNEESAGFYRYSLFNVIAAACLCHDIGNPAFGHSGEDAICNFFKKHETDLRPHFSDKEWADFTNFEGNANAIRVLTQRQNGKSPGGLLLTHSTLASIAKYPCESQGKDKRFTHRKKFGFFQSERDTFTGIAASTAMIRAGDAPLSWLRHPFVWLVEAADDICYNIIDLEDAHRLGIIEHGRCVDLLVELLLQLGFADAARMKSRLASMPDGNDQVSYLRARAIHALTMQCSELYKNNFESILNGSFDKPLFDIIREGCSPLGEITVFSRDHIYNHRSVLEIENAGYNVMAELLSHFVPGIIKPKADRLKYEEKAIRLIPSQFLYEDGSVYERVLGVLDYVCGMTDNYAADLYKKIKGIDIGMTI